MNLGFRRQAGTVAVIENGGREREVLAGVLVLREAADRLPDPSSERHRAATGMLGQKATAKKRVRQPHERARAVDFARHRVVSNSEYPLKRSIAIRHENARNDVGLNRRVGQRGKPARVGSTPRVRASDPFVTS